MIKSIRIFLFCLLCLVTIAAPAGQQPRVTEVTWNAVILHPHKVYCYTRDLNAGRYATVDTPNTFRTLLVDMKKKWGKRLKVLIKTADSADYKTIIDVLDEMTINRIARFEMVDMTAAEEKKFGQHNRSMEPPTITNYIVDEKGPAIIIHLQDSIRAGLSYLNENGQREKLADAHGREELGAAIDKAAARAGGKDKLHMQIEGTSDLPNGGFLWVIEVLRSREFYRYQFITTPE